MVEDDAVLIRDFRETDVEFVKLAAEVDDPEQLTHDCLLVGVRALRGTQTTVDIAVVDKRFGEFEHRLDEATHEAVRQIRTVSDGYLNPESGELKKMIEGLRTELDQSLGDMFDPKRKASALGKLETIFAKAVRELGDAVRDNVDPGNPKSPLGRLRLEIDGQMKDLRRTVEDLAKQIAADQTAAQTTADVLELTAIKGRRFEELVFETVSDFASLYGDEPEAVGRASGINGNQVGDVLVRLTKPDARNGRGLYVVEAKDRKMGLRQALDELGQAIDNRAAQAGVIVFASQDKAPIGAPCRAFGNKIVAILDKEEMDARPLQLALIAARLSVQRELHVAGELDVDGALVLIDEAEQVLACHTTIKGCHSKALKQISQASTHTSDLVDRVEAILRELRTKLS
jgi:hypothetical protein